MATPIVVRNYKMSDADLIQRADLLEISINRDIVEFTDRGVTAPRIALMTDARTDFADFPTDEELQGIVTVKTAEKDAIRSNIEIAIRSIRNMADVEYSGRGLYKTFGFDDLSRQKDSDLHRMAKRVARVATTLLTDLTDQGLTAPKIAALTTLNGTFDDAIDAAGEAKETRDIQTQERIKLGNELWKQMSELASIGRSIFEDTDEAKYNDYVLNDSPSSGGEGTLYEGIVAAQQEVTITNVTYSASKEIRFKNTGAAPLTFSLREEADVSAGTPITLPPSADETHTMAALNASPTATFLVVENTEEEIVGGYEVTVED